MTTEYPYAHLLRAIADGRALQFECSNGEFIDLIPQDALEVLSGARHSPKRLRIKPAMIRIGEREVPAPLRVRPARGAEYFTSRLGDHALWIRGVWDGGFVDDRLFERGLCFAFPGDAEAFTQAVLALLAPAGAQA